MPSHSLDARWDRKGALRRLHAAEGGGHGPVRPKSGPGIGPAGGHRRYRGSRRSGRNPAQSAPRPGPGFPHQTAVGGSGARQGLQPRRQSAGRLAAAVRGTTAEIRYPDICHGPLSGAKAQRPDGPFRKRRRRSLKIFLPPFLHRVLRLGGYARHFGARRIHFREPAHWTAAGGR